jgi:hypothetical protein
MAKRDAIFLRLCKNLSKELSIDLEEVLKESFFREDCELANMHWYCSKDDKTDIPSFIRTDKPFVKCQVSLENAPRYRRICHCDKKGLSYNYIIKHLESNKFFILGSECVSRLDPNALKRICQTCFKEHKCKLSFTHCSKCRTLCSVCNKVHSFNADCSQIDSKAFKLWFETLDDFQQMAVLAKRPCNICKDTHPSEHCLDKMVSFGRYKYDHLSFLDLYEKKRTYFFWLSNNGYPWLLPALEDLKRSS